MPLINDLLSQSAPYENIAVPFTDGKKQVQAIANLRKAQATGGHDILRQMEKVVVLSVIDTAWTQHLRQMDPNILAIVSSGYSDDPVMAKPAAYGFSAVLPKPYEPSDLLRLVKSVLNARGIRKDTRA